jgi:NTE family protein
LDFTLSAQGFVIGERVFKAIEGFIGDSQIENFKIPFTAVAADVTHRKEVHYRSGSLFKALRSSIAIPAVFTPVSEGRSQRVDGGVLNPLPLNLITRQEHEVVVAVNLNGHQALPKKASTEEENKERADYLRMLDAFRTQLIPTELTPMSRSLFTLSA